MNSINELAPQGEILAEENLIDRANALHEQCNGITGEISNLEKKRIETATKLGGVLILIKSACEHGEFSKFFSDKAKRLKGYDTNVNRGLHLYFTYMTGRKYMDLFESLSKRAKKELSPEDAHLLEGLKSGDEAAINEVVSKVTDAETLRQAYFDFGILKAPSPKPTPKKPTTKLFNGKRNETFTGRQDDFMDEETLAKFKEEQTESFARHINDLYQFADSGRLTHVDSQALKSSLTSLHVIMDKIKNINKN